MIRATDMIQLMVSVLGASSMPAAVANSISAYNHASGANNAWETQAVATAPQTCSKTAGDPGEVGLPARSVGHASSRRAWSTARATGVPSTEPGPASSTGAFSAAYGTVLIIRLGRCRSFGMEAG